MPSSKIVTIPTALRNWFTVHCVVDLIFAIPLFFFPERFLEMLEWPFFDPLTARLVAAALFGIGLESYLGRNSGPEEFRGMLRLKIIWSAVATAGILVTLLSLPNSPFTGWLLTVVFAGFNGLWLYWYRRLFV